MAQSASRAWSVEPELSTRCQSESCALCVLAEHMVSMQPGARLRVRSPQQLPPKPSESDNFCHHCPVRVGSISIGSTLPAVASLTMSSEDASPEPAER
eukprot:CAMPEP_0183419032 /NCGR_PEP_ID=MMETSP0370-20130417/25510_1 /TAXON_ID=268820 /ORGANISM="Peridinium aciculiferum, Strain PAER-2" /LENGTH=97 /DNA_ID=CAMNT_0025602801 /DNA_START=21 /DNA_END=314 /DNA_ORIENTATION=+